MKMTNYANFPSNFIPSHNFKEPISVSKRFIYESKIWNIKKQDYANKNLQIFSKVRRPYNTADFSKKNNETDSKSCKGILFNPTVKLINRINGESHLPKTAYSKFRPYNSSTNPHNIKQNNEQIPLNSVEKCRRFYSQKNELAYTNKSFGLSAQKSRIKNNHSTSVNEGVPGKGCIRSPKETGFQNFAKTLDKRKINGLIGTQELTRMVLYRTKNYSDAIAGLGKFYQYEQIQNYNFVSMKESTPLARSSYKEGNIKFIKEKCRYIGMSQ